LAVNIFRVSTSIHKEPIKLCETTIRHNVCILQLIRKIIDFNISGPEFQQVLSEVSVMGRLINIQNM